MRANPEPGSHRRQWRPPRRPDEVPRPEAVGEPGTRRCPARRTAFHEPPGDTGVLPERTAWSPEAGVAHGNVHKSPQMRRACSAHGSTPGVRGGPSRPPGAGPPNNTGPLLSPQRQPPAAAQRSGGQRNAPRHATPGRRKATPDDGRGKATRLSRGPPDGPERPPNGPERPRTAPNGPGRPPNAPEPQYLSFGVCRAGDLAAGPRMAGPA